MSWARVRGVSGAVSGALQAPEHVFILSLPLRVHPAPRRHDWFFHRPVRTHLKLMTRLCRRVWIVLPVPVLFLVLVRVLFSVSFALGSPITPPLQNMQSQVFRSLSLNSFAFKSTFLSTLGFHLCLLPSAF